MKLPPRRLPLLIVLALACLPGAAPGDAHSAAVRGRRAPKAGAPPASKQAAAPRASTDEGRSQMLNVSVTDDKGRHALQLGPKAFTVYLDGEPHALTHFGELDVPLSVGFVFDVSGSMIDIYKEGGRKGLGRIEELVGRFMQQGHDRNEYFVIGFNTAPHLLQDTTRDRAAVLAAIRRVAALKPYGKSAFYDACYLALEKASRGARARRVVVVLSDGMDNASRYNFEDLKRLLREQDVLLYALAPSWVEGDVLLSGHGLKGLVELTKLSGGKSFVAGGKHLEVMMDYVATELRHQYSLGIAAPAPRAKIKWRKLEVKVGGAADASGKSLKLTARTREGFYTPSATP